MLWIPASSKTTERAPSRFKVQIFFLVIQNSIYICYLPAHFFTIRTDPKPVNNLFIFIQALKRKKKTNGKKLTQELLWPWSEVGNPDRAKNQSDCKIRYRARLEKALERRSFFFLLFMAPE